MAIFTWRAAMDRALYGPGGFFVGGGDAGARPRVRRGPAAHFRTSAHASPLFALALARLLTQVDEALGQPEPFDVVDVGAGRGELLVALRSAVPDRLAARLRLTAVELAPRPAALPAGIGWRTGLPDAPVTGVLLATEWLDNVPLDVAALDPSGTPRYVCTDDSLGEPLTPVDASWVRRWWPLRPGTRAEIGTSRDAAWTAAVSTLRAGLALAVDYGHLLPDRPLLGTLTGYRDGRQVPPVPDGSCDLTAHVAFDALARAPARARQRSAAAPGLAAPVLSRQREALRALGISGARPPRALASTDPSGYLRALALAGEAGELTEAAGLGGHFWLLQAVGIDPPALPGGRPYDKT